MIGGEEDVGLCGEVEKMDRCRRLLLLSLMASRPDVPALLPCEINPKPWALQMFQLQDVPLKGCD